MDIVEILDRVEKILVTTLFRIISPFDGIVLRKQVEYFSCYFSSYNQKD